MIKLSRIDSASLFENLVHALVYREDSSTEGFLRGGPDAAQDVRGGNGSHVYQSKHHVAHQRASQIIADAKAEAKKISRYRQLGAPQYEQWAGVRTWTLCTNVERDEKTQSRWEREVVPLFAELGLSAELWDGSALLRKLERHPDLQRVFFEGRTQLLWTQGEHAETKLAAHPLLALGLRARLMGRDAELARLLEFAESEARYTWVSGPGGSGKTRLAHELGQHLVENGWQVYWLNGPEFEAGGDELYLGTMEGRVLLIVDELPSTLAVRRLLNELQANRRASAWKIVFLARSAQGTEIRELRRAAGNPFPGVELGTLSHEHCEGIANALLATDVQRRAIAVAQLAKVSGGIPLWVVLGAPTLSGEGALASLGNNASEFASTYVEELIGRVEVPPGSARSALALIGLLQPCDFNEPAVEDWFFEHASLRGDELTRFVASARAAGLIQVRRDRELVARISVDVVRDYLVRDLLTIELGPLPRRAARIASYLGRLAVSGTLSDEAAGLIVAAMANCEWSLRVEGVVVDVLGSVVAAIEGAARGDAAQQSRAAYLLSRFELARPADELGLATQLLHRGSAGGALVEVLARIAAYSREEDVVDEAFQKLVWTARHYPSLRSTALAALVSLIEAHGEATNVVSTFAAGAVEALSEIEQFDDLDLLTALAKPLLAIERHRHFSEDPTGRTGTITMFVPPTESLQYRGLWRCRETLLRMGTSTGASEGLRLAVWALLADHFSDMQCALHRLEGKVPGATAQWRADANDFLRRLVDFVAEHAPSFSVAEWKAIRPLWMPARGPIASIAEEKNTRLAEAALASVPQIAELFAILDHWKYEEYADAVESTARRIGGSTEDIVEFVNRARGFGDDTEFYNLTQRVLQALAAMGATVDRSAVHAFVHNGLKDPSDAQFFSALHVVSTWLWAARRAAPEAASDVFAEFWDILPSDARRAWFANMVFRYGHERHCHVEVDRILPLALRLADGEEQARLFGALLPSLSIDQWLLVETRLSEYPREVLYPAFSRLLERALTIPPMERRPFVGWLVEFMMAHLPSVAGLDGLARHLVDALLRDENVSFSFADFRRWLEGRANAARHNDDPEFQIAISGIDLPAALPRCSSSMGDDEREAFEAAFDLLVGDPTLHWSSLPNFVTPLDPAGDVVSEVAVDRISSLAEPSYESVAPYLFLAHSYGPGSELWRRIATHFMQQTVPLLADEDRWDLQQLLFEPPVRVLAYYGRDSSDESGLKEAEESGRSETEASLRELWTWRGHVLRNRMAEVERTPIHSRELWT